MSDFTLNAYVICPVRGVENDKLLNEFINYIEKEGVLCHYPPRDVDQTKDGFYIVMAHLKAMASCDVVLINWSEKSYGSHVDLGMAIMMSAANIPLIRLNEYSCKEKSYGTVLKQIASPALINTKNDFRKAFVEIVGQTMYAKDNKKRNK